MHPQADIPLEYDPGDEEQLYLHSVPVYKYDTSRTATPEVNDYSTVRFEKNNYSVPVRYLRRTVTVKGYADKVLIMYHGKLIATHDRLFGSGKTSYRLEHYIDLLERKGEMDCKGASGTNACPCN